MKWTDHGWMEDEDGISWIFEEEDFSKSTGHGRFIYSMKKEEDFRKTGPWTFFAEEDMKKENFYKEDLHLEDEEGGISWIFEDDFRTKRTGHGRFLQ